MRTYVAKRVLLIVPTLLGVAALVFFIMRVIPGDVPLLLLGGAQAGRIDASQIAALPHYIWVYYFVRVVSSGGLPIPSFWIGILCILLLVIYFGWGPPLEFTPPWVDPWANFQQMVWPVLTVGYRYAAVTTRMTRSTLLEVLREDYIRTAWAKGLHERAVVIRHALKTSMLPVITLVGTEFAFVIGGPGLTESGFCLYGGSRAGAGAGPQRVSTVLHAWL